MSDTPRFGCSDFADLGVPCCDSCHDDVEQGYDDMVEWDGDGWAVHVCCRVWEAICSQPDAIDGLRDKAKRANEEPKP